MGFCFALVFLYWYIILKPFRLCFYVVEVNNRKKVDWRPALVLFGRVSGWVVAPIVIALIAGKALDSRFGTAPWLFLACTGVAFIFSIYGIFREVTKYLKEISSDVKSESRPESVGKEKSWHKEGNN